jgi:short-subunit dehydrogenase
VALTETLHHDLGLVTQQLHAHVLCPYFVPTGIHRSERVRPAALTDAGAVPTRSQRVAQASSEKAVNSGKVTAAQVAQMVFDAVEAGRFHIYSHPQALASVRLRMDDIVTPRNPTDPFADRPEIGERLRQALRGEAG